MSFSSDSMKWADFESFPNHNIKFQQDSSNPTGITQCNSSFWKGNTFDNTNIKICLYPFSYTHLSINDVHSNLNFELLRLNCLILK